MKRIYLWRMFLSKKILIKVFLWSLVLGTASTYLIVDIFMKTVVKIITQVELNSRAKEAMKLNEEFADCLMKIMKAIRDEKKPNDNGYVIYDNSDEDDNKIRKIRQLLKGDVFQRIAPLTTRDAEKVGISTKTRFTLLDIYESIQKF